MSAVMRRRYGAGSRGLPVKGEGSEEALGERKRPGKPRPTVSAKR